MNKKIIAYLTLKELPGIPPFTLSDPFNGFEARWEFHKYFVGKPALESNPDFFLPIPEGRTVCPKCKGTGDVNITLGLEPMGTVCPNCRGNHIIDNPRKPFFLHSLSHTQAAKQPNEKIFCIYVSGVSIGYIIAENDDAIDDYLTWLEI